MAAAIDPARKKRAEILARTLFQCCSQIFSRRVALTMCVVKAAESAEESFVTQSLAQHVQDPGALLVIVFVEQLHQILRLRIEDRRVRLLLICEVTLRGSAHVLAESFFTVVLLNEERGKVRRETFTQPKVGPG